MDVSRLKYPVLVAGTGLLLGILADLLTYNQPLGISVPLITLLVVLAAAALALAGGVSITITNAWLIAPLLFFAAMSAVRAAPLLQFLNLAGLLMLAALIANRLAGQPVITLNIGGYLWALAESVGMSAFFTPLLLRRATAELRQGERPGAHPLRRLAIGLLIAAPFLCIFTILFSSADLVFGNAIERILEALNIPDVVGHTLLTALLAWIFMGGLAYTLTRTAAPAAEPAPPEPGEPEPPRPLLKGRLGMVESGVVLFSIDILFAIFVAIQAAALFGGEAFLRSQGLTYSEYARRGFFELLAVALITLSLILALDFLTRRDTPGAQGAFLGGSGLMIVFTIVILVSAFERLHLYELAYGFTRLRVHSHIFMVWLAAVLAAFLVLLILRRTRLFATLALIWAIGFTATLDIFNPDVFIVRQNLARYERGEDLDIAYLGSLSSDATPYLIPLLYRYGPQAGEAAGPWLRNHLDRLDARRERAGWPSYHLAHDLAFRAVDANRALLESFEPAYLYGGGTYTIRQPDTAP